MADEHPITPNRTQKEKEHIRIFVRHRKRISSSVLHKSNLLQSNSMEQLTSLIEKKLNIKKKKKNIIIVNYKPVFVNSRQQKSAEPKTSHPVQARNMTRISSDNLPFHPKPNQEPVSLDVCDVEDPFMFIEMMYQRLFTEDGQLRGETEPAVLANCVKQIVTNSRRNSMVQKDLISPNIRQRKYSTSSAHHFVPSKRTSSLSSSSHFINNTFSEEDEPNALLHINRDVNMSRRSSKRLSMENMDHQFHAFLNSYHHRQRRVSKTNRTTINDNHPLSIDDTDNEDLDTFSDLNSYRKIIRTSPTASIDEDLTHTDSKLVSSSGYQSLKSLQPIISKLDSENDHQHYCPNCTQSPVTTTVISSMNIIQPIRDTFMRFCHFILIAKNVLVLPLISFLFRQRLMYIGNLK